MAIPPCGRIAMVAPFMLEVGHRVEDSASVFGVFASTNDKED